MAFPTVSRPRNVECRSLENVENCLYRNLEHFYTCTVNFPYSGRSSVAISNVVFALRFEFLVPITHIKKLIKQLAFAHSPRKSLHFVFKMVLCWCQMHNGIKLLDSLGNSYGWARSKMFLVPNVCFKEEMSTVNSPSNCGVVYFDLFELFDSAVHLDSTFSVSWELVEVMNAKSWALTAQLIKTLAHGAKIGWATLLSVHCSH